MAVGGSFAGGFLGTNGITATGFVVGAVSGGAAGLAGGFVQGFGNSLVQEQPMEDALEVGLDRGLAGMASGAVFGGLLGGIDAASNRRAFFTGQTRRNVFQEFNPDGTVTTDLAEPDFSDGAPRIVPGNARIQNSSWFNQVQNPTTGTWTTQARMVRRLDISGVPPPGVAPPGPYFNNDAVLINPVQQNGRMLTINTTTRIRDLYISGTRPFGMPFRGLGSIGFRDEVGKRVLFGLAPLFNY